MKAGFLNAGDGDVLDGWLEAMSQVDIFGTCEMLSHPNYPAKAHIELGYLSYHGRGRLGERATQVYWNPKKIRLLSPDSKLLLPRTDIGEGAGPDHNSPKWAVGGLFEDQESFRNFDFFALHNIPTQNGNKKRREASNLWARNCRKLLMDCTNPLGMGDFNTTAHGRTMEIILKDNNLTNNQIDLGNLPTLKRRGVDMAVYRNWHVMVATDQSAKNMDRRVGKLDHKFLKMEFSMLEGKRAPR